MELPKTSDIFQAIVAKNFTYAKKLKQTLIDRGKHVDNKYITELVIGTNITELVRLANIAGAIKITSESCDYAARIGLEMLKTCLSFGSRCVHANLFHPCRECIWKATKLSSSSALIHNDQLKGVSISTR